MKHINFKKLTIQNFLSIGQEPVEIEFKNGINIINGFNRDESDIRNGVGKSSICQAFYFAIFGKTTSDLPKQYIPNRKIGRNCVVTLEFENITPSRGSEIFKIERCLSPSRLRVWKNGKEKTKSSIPETTKYISEVLSANEEVFQDCIFMRANSTIPFMAKKRLDKKNFIESIFNLSVFSDMLKLLKDDLRDLRRDYDIQNTQFQSLKSNETQYIDALANLEIENVRRRDEHKEKIERLNQQIMEIDSHRAQLRLQDKDEVVDETKIGELNDKVNKCETYIRTIIQKDAELRAKMKQLQSEAKRIMEKGEVCPTCGKPYDKDDVDLRKVRLSEIAAEGREIKVNVEKLLERQKQFENSKQQYKGQVDALRQASYNVRLIKEKIKADTTRIELYQKQIDELKQQNPAASSEQFTKLLDECRNKIGYKQEVVDKLEKELSMMGVCEFILSDIGVRKFIVGKLLELLNGRIKHYLSAFKSTFEFTFDDKFEETIHDSGGVECLYANCSGAEQKKIDLAISFAFLDILKYHQQVEYNIQFYDEILDSSVDAKSLELIIEFIQKHAVENQRCMYIVTHKGEITLPSVTEYITLEKVNGFTRRIETE